MLNLLEDIYVTLRSHEGFKYHGSLSFDKDKGKIKFNLKNEVYDSGFERKDVVSIIPTGVPFDTTHLTVIGSLCLIKDDVEYYITDVRKEVRVLDVNKKVDEIIEFVNEMVERSIVSSVNGYIPHLLAENSITYLPVDEEYLRREDLEDIVVVMNGKDDFEGVVADAIAIKSGKTMKVLIEEIDSYIEDYVKIKDEDYNALMALIGKADLVESLKRYQTQRIYSNGKRSTSMFTIEDVVYSSKKDKVWLKYTPTFEIDSSVKHLFNETTPVSIGESQTAFGLLTYQIDTLSNQLSKIFESQLQGRIFHLSSNLFALHGFHDGETGKDHFTYDHISFLPNSRDPRDVFKYQRLCDYYPYDIMKDIRKTGFRLNFSSYLDIELYLSTKNVPTLEELTKHKLPLNATDDEILSALREMLLMAYDVLPKYAMTREEYTSRGLSINSTTGYYEKPFSNNHGKGKVLLDINNSSSLVRIGLEFNMNLGETMEIWKGVPRRSLLHIVDEHFSALYREVTSDADTYKDVLDKVNAFFTSTLREVNVRIVTTYDNVVESLRPVFIEVGNVASHVTRESIEVIVGQSDNTNPRDHYISVVRKGKNFDIPTVLAKFKFTLLDNTDTLDIGNRLRAYIQKEDVFKTSLDNVIDLDTLV